LSRFNLIDEKWIPVRFPDGSRAELGIRETLLRAKEIACIEDGSPLVVAALHRFLLAVLYRALEGPTDIQQAKALFKSGFPTEKISDYLEKWKPRFWLFDDKYPFGQNPNVPVGEDEPWTKLTAEYNATSNKVLFDHTDTRMPGVKQLNECVRWLISTMGFSLSGGRGYFPSPSPNAMMCIPIGQNLEKTLSFCLVPYPNRDVMECDSALWERVPIVLPIKVPKRASNGYADQYTWQPRMILLEDQEAGIGKMRFVAGEGFENVNSVPDPMHPYREDKVNGRLPVQFRPERGTWRDFDSLIPDLEGLAPLTIQNAFRLSGNSSDNLPNSILILGLRYYPPSANVGFWRMDQFRFPISISGDKFVRSDVKNLLDKAEDVQKSLWSSCKTYARWILGKGKDREPAGSDVSNFLSQMPSTPWYWASLERDFHEILRDIFSGKNQKEIELKWILSLRTALTTAWTQHKISVSVSDAWAIRALVKSESFVLKKTAELEQTINEFRDSLKKEQV
jgi:CRISPR system Cascade subunit CasA